MLCDTPKTLIRQLQDSVEHHRREIRRHIVTGYRLTRPRETADKFKCAQTGLNGSSRSILTVVDFCCNSVDFLHRQAIERG